MPVHLTCDGCLEPCLELPAEAFRQQLCWPDGWLTIYLGDGDDNAWTLCPACIAILHSTLLERLSYANRQT